MDYEKEYKEAFKRAERRFDPNPADGYAGYANGIIEDIFPQFIKREDERTRKEILDFIKHFWADHKESIPRISSWLAWLEKQKINTEGDFGRGYDCGYEACLNSHGAEWFEKQKEQKPVEYLPKEKVFGIMSELTNLSFSPLIPLNSNEYKRLNEITGAVRSLLDYPIEQKPAEWSEEDEERLINTSISFLKDFADKGYENAVECIGWLKSLRPSWKPSEEQMKALLKVVDKARELHYSSNSGYNEYDVLRSLYKQLEQIG